MIVPVNNTRNYDFKYPANKVLTNITLVQSSLNRGFSCNKPKRIDTLTTYKAIHV